MKKLLFFTVLIFLTSMAFGQSKMRKGGSFGDERVSGTNINVLDSLTYVGTMYFMYRIGDTSMVYIPVADRVVIGDVALEKEMTLNEQTGTSYTPELSDAAKLITLDNGGAITLTVPTNAAVAFPIGTQITFVQLGAGQVTFAGAGPPTISSADGDLKLRVQYSSATLIKIDTDIWILIGDIDA